MRARQSSVKHSGIHMSLNTHCLNKTYFYYFYKLLQKGVIRYRNNPCVHDAIRVLLLDLKSTNYFQRLLNGMYKLRSMYKYLETR